jgi:thiamine biosynthesis protein ThiS
VTIRLNGAPHETATETIASLLDELGLPRQTVLVERNAQPLPRKDWETATLNEGDAIEILRVAAGG